MPSNVGSLRIAGAPCYTICSTTLLDSVSAYTISWFVKYNSVPSGVISLLFSTTFDPIASIDGTGHVNYNLFYGPGPSDNSEYNRPYNPGCCLPCCRDLDCITGHGGCTLTRSWSNQEWAPLYPRGHLRKSSRSGAGISHGWTGDVQFSNVAIWNNYAATAADVLNLRNAVYDPSTLIGSVSRRPAAGHYLVDAGRRGLGHAGDLRQ